MPIAARKQVPASPDQPSGPGRFSVLNLPAKGVTLRTLAAGPEQGPLVILLHGFPEDGFAWRRQIEALAAAGMRVLAPDQRGYGGSGKPQGIGQYRLDILADDVLGLADAVGRRRFSVVGHDWGAALAWLLAERHPQRIERAAVLNGPHPGTVLRHALRAPSQFAKGWYIGFFQLPALPEWTLRSGGHAWLRTMLAATSRPGTFDEQDFRHYIQAWEQPGALTAMLNWYRALPLWSGAGPAAAIEAPVRVIWGDRDAFLDPQLAEAGLERCRHGEAFHLAGATHWLHHEEPERVNALLTGFLAG